MSSLKVFDLCEHKSFQEEIKDFYQSNQKFWPFSDLRLSSPNFFDQTWHFNLFFAGPYNFWAKKEADSQWMQSIGERIWKVQFSDLDHWTELIWLTFSGPSELIGNWLTFFVIKRSTADHYFRSSDNVFQHIESKIIWEK